MCMYPFWYCPEYLGISRYYDRGCTVCMYCLRMVRVSLNTQSRGMYWYSFWYCPMIQCQTILGTQNTLTRGVVCMCSSRYRPRILGYSDKRVLCMCSSWYCPVIVRASWDLSQGLKNKVLIIMRVVYHPHSQSTLRSGPNKLFCSN